MGLAEILLVVDEELLGEVLGVRTAFCQGVECAAAERVLGKDARLAVIVSLSDEILLLAVTQRWCEYSGDVEVLERSDSEGDLAVEGVTPGVVESTCVDTGIGVRSVVARAHSSI